MCVLVVEVGSDVIDLVDKECLVLINHQATGDVPILIHLFSHWGKANLITNLYWILDNMFKFTHFGLVARAREDFFILQVSRAFNNFIFKF